MPWMPNSKPSLTLLETKVDAKFDALIVSHQ